MPGLRGIVLVSLAVVLLSLSSYASAETRDSVITHRKSSTSAEISGFLAYKAGLIADSASGEQKLTALYSEKSPEDDSVYLRPRQLLQYEATNFDLFVDGCDYPIVEYYLYASEGYVDVEVIPLDADQDVAAILRTNGSYPTPGTNVLILDNYESGSGESGQYYCNQPTLFVLLIGFSSIDDCDPYGMNWIEALQVWLNYTPYEWDLRYESITTSTPYPNASVTLTARLKNHSVHTLCCGYPWYYGFDVGLWLQNDCVGSPFQTRMFNGVLPHGGAADFTYTIQGSHSGQMHTSLLWDCNDSLPSYWQSSWGCAAGPTLLWSVDLSGDLRIREPTSASWQSLPYFRFDIVRIVGSDTLVLDEVTTNSTGHYSSTIPSGNYNIYYRFTSDQPGLLYPVRRTQSPSRCFSGIWNTGTDATSKCHNKRQLVRCSSRW